jgi:hypothetical protein
MMQMSIAGDQHAIVDAEAHSEAHFDATKRDDTHEMKASAVECMCEQEATVRQEGCREVKGRMKTRNRNDNEEATTTKRSVQKCRREKGNVPVHTMTIAVTFPSTATQPLL